MVVGRNAATTAGRSSATMVAGRRATTIAGRSNPTAPVVRSSAMPADCYSAATGRSPPAGRNRVGATIDRSTHVDRNRMVIAARSNAPTTADRTQRQVIADRSRATIERSTPAGHNRARSNATTVACLRRATTVGERSQPANRNSARMVADPRSATTDHRRNPVVIADRSNAMTIAGRRATTVADRRHPAQARRSLDARTANASQETVPARPIAGRKNSNAALVADRSHSTTTAGHNP